ncbi:MAG: hypothetical protein N2487_05435 [Verrucomicrobiae bacterium]|nr:hypothetical protein [Verrucomicrobiae bacterium]
MSVNPVRILPDLQFSVVCEDLRREITGKFIIIGVVDAIVVPSLPFRLGRLFVFNRWACGVGDFIESVKLIAPDDSTILAKTDVKFVLQSPLETASTVSVFNGIELKTQGFYYIEVTVDDVRKIRVPINVVVAPRQQQGQETEQKKQEQTPQPASQDIQNNENKT